MFNNKQNGGENVLKKFWTILLTLLVLLIPIGFLFNIIHERENYRKEAVESVAYSWGSEQTLETPKLLIGDKELNLEDYSADIKIKTEIRKKGIFKIPLYVADVELQGNFLNIYGTLSNKAVLSFEVKDSKGFIEEPVYQLNNSTPQKAQSTTISINLTTNSPRIPFKISYKIRGLNAINLYAKAKNNNVKISGDWNSPSFSGHFLPNSRKIEKNSFAAEWKIPNIAKLSNAKGPEIEVSLLIPVDNYRMCERTLKYSFLFLLLTFISYFIFEITSKENRKIHPLQYCLLGGAMQIFYLLLVSLSEFAPFLLSYLIASLMIISLVTIYTYFVITKAQGKTFTAVIAGLMSILYAFLYILLSLQDLALLIGSLGIFFVMCAIMYVTRNIEWYKE